MKNIHILPKNIFNQLGVDHYGKTPTQIKIAEFLISKHIHITSDEEIKEGDWTLMFDDFGNLFLCDKPQQYLGIEKGHHLNKGLRKIILTTDPTLIADGVQPIDDEFLEWFVKNPSCEFVEVIKDLFQVNQNNPVLKGSTALVKQHKIIIPQEEPKQNEMVGNQFYKSADKVISINKKYNMRHKTVLNISIEDKGNYKNIFKIKSKYYKLNNEEKEALLKGLLFWARQEMNNLHPEQE